MTKLQIGLWIDSSYSPDLWLLSVPKLKNLARWEEILVKWGIVAINEYFADFETAYFKWLPNVNYASFLAEIWPEGVRRMDLSRCRVIKWIVAPFHGNLPNLSKRPTYMKNIRIWSNYYLIYLLCMNILKHYHIKNINNTYILSLMLSLTIYQYN